MAAAPTPTPPETFAQKISNSGALQLVGVIANISGILSSALAFYSFIDGLNQPSNADILNAIQQLEQTLQSDFTQLGDLIVQQTQVAVDAVNRDAMAQALANSDVANARIQAFLTSHDQAALETAITESIAGVQFFLELNLTTPADLLFFLPGLVKAGSIRLFVIASEPKAKQEPAPVIIGSITSMANLLSTMVSSIAATITAAHTVNEKSHVIKCSVLPQVVTAAKPDIGAPSRQVTVIDGYSHEELGVVLQFFNAQNGNPPANSPPAWRKGLSLPPNRREPRASTMS